MQTHGGMKMHGILMEGGSSERLEGKGLQSGVGDRTSRALSDIQEFALHPEGTGEPLECLEQGLADMARFLG